MTDWDELTEAIFRLQQPILPQPTWGQDAVFVAFIIDGLVNRVSDLQTVVDDLWGCIAQPEIDDLQPETIVEAKAVHKTLWHDCPSS